MGKDTVSDRMVVKVDNNSNDSIEFEGGRERQRGRVTAFKTSLAIAQPLSLYTDGRGQREGDDWRYIGRDRNLQIQVQIQRQRQIR